MPQFKVNVCFTTPGKAWHQDTSRNVTQIADAGNGVQAVMAVLECLEFDERAERVHFIHVDIHADAETAE